MIVKSGMVDVRMTGQRYELLVLNSEDHQPHLWLYLDLTKYVKYDHMVAVCCSQ